MDAPAAWILTEPLAGLRAQALGLAEALGLRPVESDLARPGLWARLPARLWPASVARRAAGPRPPGARIVIGCGGKAAAALAALRAPDLAVVQIQHPRMDPARFDAVVVNPHDRLAGPNVIVSRTAIHRVSPARLAAEAEAWRARFAALPRPLVSVLLGGSNGRYAFGAAEAGKLGADLAAMARAGAGIAVTPSRRTDPAAVAALRAALAEALAEARAYIWDMEGGNPYFGMLGLADGIVVTQDSVSMVSEASATSAPVWIVRLPGRSRRQGTFLEGMLASGRARLFDGAWAPWPVAPLNDTPDAAARLRRLLGDRLPS
jgi:mitochondrial fission protein ELM1